MGNRGMQSANRAIWNEQMIVVHAVMEGIVPMLTLYRPETFIYNTEYQCNIKDI